MNKHFPESSIRSQQYCGANGDADVICDSLPGFHIEVKRTETFSMRKYCKQARDDCDARIAKELKNTGVNKDITPLLVHRFNGGKWMAVIEADELLGLLKELKGYKGVINKISISRKRQEEYKAYLLKYPEKRGENNQGLSIR